ncbi:3'-5' exoribonuclease [Aeromonas veronii]|uniref:3'-5' exonuclease n=1 Tax=Aeromonas veronii TaxID=654 RepID=UPI00207D289D|nr:3'-5' exonuclease [Aeromonas veronii]MCO4171822.1 3'-5' exoribonuclease [Aeromonas veronii]
MIFSGLSAKPFYEVSAERVAVADIETLGQGADAVICSIAVVVVDLGSLVVVDEFYCRVDHNQVNRSRSEGTLAFWEQQRQESPAAWDELFNPAGQRLFITSALELLATFLLKAFGHIEDVQLMGNGSEFDNVILAHAYEQWGMEQPWHFRGNQSLRTAVWMGRVLLGIDPKYQLPFEGSRHIALHDARHEAAYLIAILKAFRERMAGGEA